MLRSAQQVGTPISGATRKLADGRTRIDFATHPSRYRHWKLSVDGPVATLTMDVDEKGGLYEGYELKLNSYDLRVDIELADALQRLRFEHPAVRVILLRSGKPREFCAGAIIRMLAGASHPDKVNFCKFTNETRLALEDASAHSGQRSICVITGTAAGGGYELALAADHIILVDDGSSTVSLPELPLLAVLPGTGGLTRVTDKRKVRRDLADVFCTTEEGVKGRRAAEWRLVNELVPNSRLEEVYGAGRSVRDAVRPARRRAGDCAVAAAEARLRRCPRLRHPDGAVRPRRAGGDRDPARSECATAVRRAGHAGAGADFWPLRLARELDDAILDIRHNELDVAVIVFKSEGDPHAVLAYEALLEAQQGHWLAREILLLWKRVLKRVDLTSRSLVTLVEPGSCFAGTLAELIFAADRSYMLIGAMDGDNRPPRASCCPPPISAPIP